MIKYLYHRSRYRKLSYKLGFSISMNSLGYGVVIPHYGSIVVNGETILGNYCVLHTSTCIAGKGKVGNGLYLSTGSILKNPNLGDFVSVAANSLVERTEQPLSNVLLAGTPAIVKRENYCKWYVRDGWTEKIGKIEEYRKSLCL